MDHNVDEFLKKTNVQFKSRMMKRKISKLYATNYDLSFNVPEGGDQKADTIIPAARSIYTPLSKARRRENQES